MKGWRFIIIGIVVVLIPGVLLAYLLRPSPIVQPIQFNHKIHLESESSEGQENITCETCHKYYNTRIVAGRPSINTCLTCHTTSSEQKEENPEIDKLLEFGERGEEIPWEKIYDVPDHVFFSHRRHTSGLQYSSGGEAAEFREEYKDEEQDNEGGKQIREPIACEACHGPIAETVTPPPAPLKKIAMKTCINCHKQEQVTVDCNACHR
jgi:Class III cytochrome C family